MASVPFTIVTETGGAGGGAGLNVVPTGNITGSVGPDNTDSNGLSTLDLSKYFSMFGFDNPPTNFSDIASNPAGFFTQLQTWVANNPGATLLVGLLLLTMVGGALGPGGGLSGTGKGTGKHR